MEAIVLSAPGEASVETIPSFSLRPKYIKINVRAVALNPSDWKHIDFVSDAGAVIGCDVAGIVQAVGEEVISAVKPGDAVFGFVHGANISNHEDGAFAESCVIKDGLFMHKPETLSFEEAASFPIGVGTVGQALYQTLGLPFPGTSDSGDWKEPILIYGGSTATGTLAIQFLKLSGVPAIATASPKNHELLYSLGVDKVFDYNDRECGSKIREYTGGRLRCVLDCIAADQSAEICAEALSSTTAYGELRYVALLPPQGFPRSDVTATGTFLHTATDETFTKIGLEFKPNAEDSAWMRDWFKIVQGLINAKRLKTHPLEAGEGLDGVLQGLDKMRKGDYNARKLVYTIAE